MLNSEMEYEYNITIESLGEGWMHTIEFEGYLPDQNIVHPICLDGERACPPEHLEGYPKGYYKFLEIMQDINHPDREDVMYHNDIENNFNSEKFDKSTVRYRKYFTPTSKKEYW